MSLNLIVPWPFFLAGNTVDSISIVEPKNPLTPNPYTWPTSYLSKLSNLSNGEYLPIEITSSTSFKVILLLSSSPLVLNNEYPYASDNIFTAFLPSIVYWLINLPTPSSNSTSSFSDALLTMPSISCEDNGSKYTSVHLDLNAGFIWLGSFVVAPIKTKSAGAPFSNKYLIYSGIFSSSGS